MRITQIQQNYYYNSKPTDNHKLNFSSNPKSNLLGFHYKDFYINIEGYGKNKDWAEAIKKTANRAVKDMQQEKTADEILVNIVKGTKIANGFSKNIVKRQHTGIIRTDRSGYGKTGEWKEIELVTPLSKQYKTYESKLTPIANKPLKSPYRDIGTAKIEKGNWIDYGARIVHPDNKYINNALDRVGKKYSDLKKDYISKPENVTKETLPLINSDIAEIRWIMAHSMPWERGSDAISNVFTRSLYKSMGIKTYPLKQGISLDLEAFCTPLEKYKQNFSTYFEKAPEVVE